MVHMREGWVLVLVFVVGGRHVLGGEVCDGNNKKLSNSDCSDCMSSIQTSASGCGSFWAEACYQCCYEDSGSSSYDNFFTCTEYKTWTDATCLSAFTCCLENWRCSDGDYCDYAWSRAYASLTTCDATQAPTPRPTMTDCLPTGSYNCQGSTGGFNAGNSVTVSSTRFYCCGSSSSSGQYCTLSSTSTLVTLARSIGQEEQDCNLWHPPTPRPTPEPTPQAQPTPEPTPWPTPEPTPMPTPWAVDCTNIVFPGGISYDDANEACSNCCGAQRDWRASTYNGVSTYSCECTGAIPTPRPTPQPTVTPWTPVPVSIIPIGPHAGGSDCENNVKSTYESRAYTTEEEDLARGSCEACCNSFDMYTCFTYDYQDSIIDVTCECCGERGDDHLTIDDDDDDDDGLPVVVIAAAGSGALLLASAVLFGSYTVFKPQNPPGIDPVTGQPQVAGPVGVGKDML